MEIGISLLTSSSTHLMELVQWTVRVKEDTMLIHLIMILKKFLLGGLHTMDLIKCSLVAHGLEDEILILIQMEPPLTQDLDITSNHTIS
jgi:hypothetical protein